jgi:hypothetical protein
MDKVQRSPSDFILFAINFVGFVAALAGLITSTVPICILGVLMLLFGLGGFMVKSAFGE